MERATRLGALVLMGLCGACTVPIASDEGLSEEVPKGDAVRTREPSSGEVDPGLAASADGTPKGDEEAGQVGSDDRGPMPDPASAASPDDGVPGDELPGDDVPSGGVPDDSGPDDESLVDADYNHPFELQLTELQGLGILPVPDGTHVWAKLGTSGSVAMGAVTGDAVLLSWTTGWSSWSYGDFVVVVVDGDGNDTCDPGEAVATLFVSNEWIGDAPPRVTMAMDPETALGWGTTSAWCEAWATEPDPVTNPVDCAGLCAPRAPGCTGGERCVTECEAFRSEGHGQSAHDHFADCLENEFLCYQTASQCAYWRMPAVPLAPVGG